MTERHTDGWSRRVIAELERGHQERKELAELVTRVRLDVVSLKTRASVWGAVAGAVLSLLVGIVLHLVS